MADVTLKIDPNSTTRVGSHDVYVKLFWHTEWGDPVENLYAQDVTINAAPSFSTATLYHRYGRGLLQGANAYADVPKLANRNRYFVKVDLTDLAGLTDNENGDTYEWIGTIEIDNDRLLGASAGKQELVCYGIEHSLHMEPVLSAQWWDSFGEKQREAGIGFTFNAGNQENRTNLRYGGSFLFADDPTDTTNRFWSTRSIVEYLLEHHSPKSIFGNKIVRFELVDDGNVLPDWDQPELQTHGRTVFELLNTLISRQRLMSWYVNITPGGTVQIKPFSLAEEKLQLEDGKSFTANASKKTLDFHGDPTADAVLVTNSVDRVDQVYVQGARRTSTATISWGGNEIDEGWTLAQEVAYEAGASGAGDYPASTEPAEREQRNRDARSADELKAVFRRFVLHDDFYEKNEASTDADRTAGGTVIFPGAEDQITVEKKHIVPRNVLRIRDRLVLQERHDYSGGKIAADTVTTTGDEPYAELSPLVIAPLPSDPSFYVQIEQAGQIADIETSTLSSSNRQWSASVDIAGDGQAIIIDVSGNGLQHVLAINAFAALTPAADHGERLVHDFNYEDFLFTLTFEEDRYCEAVYPENIVGVGNKDIRRRRVFDVGDNYRLDYVAPDTVVAVDPATGDVDLSDGGFVRDDRAKLKQIAEMLHTWYGINRTSLTLSSGELEPNLLIGDMITTANEEALAIYSCVTSISISIPAGSGSAPPPPRVKYTLQFGELDPLQLFPI